MSMRRIIICISRAEIRNLDDGPTSRFKYAMNFIHRSDNVIYVLKGMIEKHQIEAVVLKRPWGLIEVMHHIYVRELQDIHANSAGQGACAATDVERPCAGAYIVFNESGSGVYLGGPVIVHVQ